MHCPSTRWGAVLSEATNGITRGIIVIVMVNLANNRRVMTQFTLGPWLHAIGRSTATVMALCVVRFDQVRELAPAT